MANHSIEQEVYLRFGPSSDKPSSTASWNINGIHEARAKVRELVGRANRSRDRIKIYLNDELQFDNQPYR